jgi:hypothetical protein
MIMDTFAAASGLHTNIQSVSLPLYIQCSEDQVVVVQQHFPCQLVNFPCRYLGVPLSIFKLKKSDLQPLVDHLPTWKSRLMSRAGGTALTKVTLSAIPIHVSIAAPWIYHATDKLRRAFICTTGSDSVHRGQ